jgi:hypothetical protein
MNNIRTYFHCFFANSDRAINSLNIYYALVYQKRFRTVIFGRDYKHCSKLLNLTIAKAAVKKRYLFWNTGIQ